LILEVPLQAVNAAAPMTDGRRSPVLESHIAKSGGQKAQSE
jgi:hypothetical protein